MSERQATMVGDVDVRGFAHALAALRKRAQWRLQSLRVQLTRQRLQVKEQERLLETIAQALHCQSGTAQAALAQRVDPHGHRQSLLYLADLHRQWDQGQCTLTRERERLARLMQAGCAQQRRLEGLERHHDDALAHYAADKRSRDCAELDRDWIARRELLQAQDNGHTPD